MAFDRKQAEEVFERALAIDAALAPTFDRADLQRLADELGVSESAMSQAISEAIGGQPGPRNAVAQATIPAPVSEVRNAFDSFFSLRGLYSRGSGVWEQGSGWWPDLYRFRAITPVALTIVESGEGSAARLTARLDSIWRVHLIGALLAPLTLVLAVLGIGPPMSRELLFGCLAWMIVAVATLQLRQEAVRRRLAGALNDVSRPAYRLQPW